MERKKHGSKSESERFNYWVNKGDAEIPRDYEVFALLAGVRNTNEIKPIALPKGEPETDNEFSDEFKNVLEAWNGDAHSTSYLTLAELKKADIEQEIYDRHVITDKDKDGKIIGTALMTTGRHFGDVGKRKVFGLWDRDKENWDKILVSLEALKAEDYTDDDVRLVFFFDN